MSDTDGARMRAILVLAAAVAFILFSYLAPDFQGYRTDQMPYGEPRPPIQPAGYAFAIWGLIYLWLIIGAGFGLLQRADAPDWDAHRLPLIGALVLGAGWLWVAVQSPILATVMIWAMLVLSILALARAPVRDFWFARAPIGLFAGWLTAASFVSLGLVLAGYGLFASGWLAALVCLPLAAAFAVAIYLWLAPGGGYAFAAGWGFVGIAVANMERHAEIAVLAVIGAAVLAGLWWRQRFRRG
ncbi:hypothetical protein [Pararhodobacter sp. SW119]|uniref:hypothetical protein n=1 Tax=Pararhodobacter sp. SW119 TaxID=2780075 RepID=UPI001ADF0F3B|nr:hypothetical protein [Pararhodobacter sp. SW119]